MSNNVNKNTLFNTIKSIFSLIYPLITFPYVSRILMADNLGKINFSNSIISYFSLIASLGINTYAIRECSKAKNDKKLLDKVSSQIFSINILSTIVAYVALFIVVVTFKSITNYWLLIAIQSVSILAGTIGAEWINSAMEEFKYISIRTMAFQVLALILMFLFVKKPEDYYIYAIISVIASCGSNIINIYYRKRFCNIRFTLDFDIKKHLPPIMLMFSMMLTQVIYCNSDITILGLIKGDFEVGLYSTSVKIYSIVNTTIASVAWVVMPQLSEGFAQKDYSRINNLLKYALNYIFVLGIPTLIGINVITDDIIMVIAGKEYLGAVTSLKILTIALLFSFIGGWIANMMFIPAGKESICLKTGMVSAIINIILNFIFIPKYGLNAAAATTAIAEFTGVILKIPYLDNNIKIDNLKNVFLGPCVGSIFILIIGISVKKMFTNSFIILLITITLSIFCYLMILLILKNEFVINYLKPVFNKFNILKEK